MQTPNYLITKNKNGDNTDIKIKPLNKYSQEFGNILLQINALSKTVLEYKTKIMELEGIYKQTLNIEAETVSSNLVYINKSVDEKEWEKLIKKLNKK